MRVCFRIMFSQTITELPALRDLLGSKWSLRTPETWKWQIIWKNQFSAHSKTHKLYKDSGNKNKKFWHNAVKFSEISELIEKCFFLKQNL